MEGTIEDCNKGTGFNIDILRVFKNFIKYNEL